VVRKYIKEGILDALHINGKHNKEQVNT